jgi:hypothetical protein
MSQQTTSTPPRPRLVSILPSLIVLGVAAGMFFYGTFGSRFRLYYMNESSDPYYFAQDVAAGDSRVSDTFDGPYPASEAKLVEESTYEGMVRNRQDARYRRDVLVKMPREAPRKECST